ncbi:NACHT N-terminal Helical domain 1-containing protein [Nonomuraea sp. LPB2021202275-12-8]|uniref:NACHT N-terminal Helical domain 1-containing protein n=1 Tax=Nonomuraea sp. LPB2021202275-12-8 TaxID=3120159 RepID=UPI00300C62ED
MALETAALGLGKAVGERALRTVLTSRASAESQSKDLVELMRARFPDHLVRRKAERQLGDIADAVTARVLKVCAHEFPGLGEDDRLVVLAEVTGALTRADLSDSALLAADADPVRLARAVRESLPAPEDLGEPASRLYEVVLDECCDCLVRIVRHLPEFGPRAAAETLARLSGVGEQIATVLERLPVRTLEAPEGTDRDAEFRRRYLEHVSQTLDNLELLGVRVERFRPRTSLSVAYISLSVSALRPRTAHESWHEVPDEPATMRVESALGQGRRMLLRGEAGGGKSTLLRWLAITAARGGFEGELTGWHGCVPFLVKLRSYADRDQWREVVVMAAGHANGPLREELLGGLLTRMAREPRYARRLKVLVCACLETLPSVPERLGEAVDGCLSDLIPPRDVASARSLATAGQIVLDRLPRDVSGLSPAAARACVRTAWLVNGPLALDVLSGYAHDGRVEVERELIEGWRYFEPGLYAQRVLSSVGTIGERLVVHTSGQFDALRRLPPQSSVTVRVPAPADLSPLLAHRESLRRLWLNPTVSTAALRTLRHLTGLTSITLRQVEEIGFLSGLRGLVEVELGDASRLTDFTPLRDLTELRHLQLLEAAHLTGWDMLPPLDGLLTLHLSGAPVVTSVRDIVERAPRLLSLELQDYERLADLDALPRLDLTRLVLWGTRELEDISPLAGCVSLVSLDLDGTRVRDLRPLVGLERLQFSISATVSSWRISPPWLTWAGCATCG